MARRVKFDFDGSLRLARKLYSLADSIETAHTSREGHFEVAKARWEGTYGEQFVGRRENERTKESNAVGQLRSEAELWAQAWADALHQQNLYNRGEYIEELAQQKKSDRGLFERGTDFVGFTEDTSYEEAASEVPIPPHPAKPSAPGYEPTAVEKQYS